MLSILTERAYMYLTAIGIILQRKLQLVNRVDGPIDNCRHHHLLGTVFYGIPDHNGIPDDFPRLCTGDEISA